MDFTTIKSMDMPICKNLTLNDSSIPCQPDIIEPFSYNDEVYVFLTFYLLVITPWSILINAVVIYVTIADKMLHKPHYIIMLNVPIADLGIALFANSTSIYNAYNKGQIHGSLRCIVNAFLRSELGMAQVATIAVMAEVRRRMICTYSARNEVTWSYATVHIVLIWVYATCMSIGPVIGIGEFGGETAEISCAPAWLNRSTENLSYLAFLLVFGLGMPLFIFMTSYVCIVLHTRRASKNRAGKTMKKNYDRLFNLIVLMVGLFYAAWGPYAIVCIYSFFSGNAVSGFWAGVLPSLMAKSSGAINPLIYFIYGREFRTALARQISFTKCLLSIDSGNEDGDNNNRKDTGRGRQEEVTSKQDKCFPMEARRRSGGNGGDENSPARLIRSELDTRQTQISSSVIVNNNNGE